MQPVVIDLVGKQTPKKDRRSLPMHFCDLTVTAIEVSHDSAEPAYGYRFDYQGRSAVISGDTNYHPPLAFAAQGTDVLVHDAQSQHLLELIQSSAKKVGNARLAQLMGAIYSITIQTHWRPPGLPIRVHVRPTGIYAP